MLPCLVKYFLLWKRELCVVWFWMGAVITVGATKCDNDGAWHGVGLGSVIWSRPGLCSSWLGWDTHTIPRAAAEHQLQQQKVYSNKEMVELH